MLNNLINNLQNSFLSAPEKDYQFSINLPGWKKTIGIDYLPHKSITEIFGGSSQGKTTLALSLIKEVQKNAGQVLLITSEPFDGRYAFNLGVNLDSLILLDTNEEYFMDILDTILSEVDIGLVVIDSLSAINIKDAKTIVKKLLIKADKNNMSLVVTNQMRWNPYTGIQAKGGVDIKKYFSLRIEIKRVSKKYIIKTVKNKYGTPLIEGEILL